MKRSLQITSTNGVLEWRDRTTNEVVFHVIPSQHVHESIREKVFEYGVKQIINDSGAVGANVPLSERLAKMDIRLDSLIYGTWGTRTTTGGLGTHTALFHACVAAQLVEDTPEKREQFKKLTPKQIVNLYKNPAVAEHLGDEESEDFLA